eukprot:m.440018 g.440018  ORF g.440018 m.440018 type:complete len:523 (-) comp20276_c1_seq72:931-2499(-)
MVQAAQGHCSANKPAREIFLARAFVFLPCRPVHLHHGKFNTAAGRGYHGQPAAHYHSDVMVIGVFQLVPFQPSLSWQEIVVLVWMVGYFIDEVAEMKNLGLVLWFEDKWNVWDLSTCLTYTLAFVLRLAEIAKCSDTDASDGCTDLNGIAKFWGGLVLAQLYIRIFRFLAISKTLGPNLLVFQLMVWDTSTFLVFLALCLCAYGTLMHTILFPDDEFTLDVFLLRPLFQTFGEVYLEEYNELASCSSNTFLFQGCGNSNLSLTWAIPVLMAAYLFVVNIMLVNLLIAMFSSRYDTVQRRAEVLWLYQFYYLYVEYLGRPYMPFPFSAIEYAIRAILKPGQALRDWYGNRRTRNQSNSSFEYKQLEYFSERQTEQWIEQRDKREAASSSHVLHDLQRKTVRTHNLIAEAISKLTWLEAQRAQRAARLATGDFPRQASDGPVVFGERPLSPYPHPAASPSLPNDFWPGLTPDDLRSWECRKLEDRFPVSKQLVSSFEPNQPWEEWKEGKERYPYYHQVHRRGRD